MKTTRTICDECERDLTKTNNVVGYRLALITETIMNTGGVVTDMAAHRPLDSDKHFCDTHCLKNWVEKSL